MFQKLSPVITGTIYLSAAGILTRCLGFFYKIWLGNLIGPEELGIYQLVFPVFSICLAICGGPFQTAVSKFTAQYQEQNPSKSKCCLQAALALSVLFAIFCAAFILLFHKEISVRFLLNERTDRLLPYIAFSIPLSAIHNCITGWYYGQKKAAVPALSNLMEQGSRMLFVFCLLQCNFKFSVLQVVWALCIGEMVSAVFTAAACLLERKRRKSRQNNTIFSAVVPVKPYIGCVKEIMLLIWPLTANRLIMSLLQSAESVMIPSRLILSGLTEQTALSMYGALTGMALSFILFPTALTGSFSLMLMPDIAKACAENRISYIRKASQLSLCSTFFIGCLFTAVFFLFGESIGNLCFPGTLAGTYIRSLSWLCPFLYLNNILISILHGMGLTALTFKTQLSGLTLRLGMTVFLVPLYGMSCYFIALLGSQILMCVFNLYYLYQLRVLH
ncbi:MAG: oligosaccharide flippase family protein [Lachnospiraceae bacterium]|nr:oligosaccharide flippase family protein [Lachnospiraceae bacterium]